MSFTDAMYEGIREFYFRGTPYPSHVGVNEGNNKKGEATKTETNLDVTIDEAEKEGESDSEEDGNASGKSDSIGESEDMMNCYPSRPSSAFVITNESPPIWFQPMEVFEVSFADITVSTAYSGGRSPGRPSRPRGCLAFSPFQATPTR